MQTMLFCIRIEGQCFRRVVFCCYIPFTLSCNLQPTSACYAALKQWQKAYEDAVMSVSKDPKFIKGYLRLSTAQTELQLFDDAETTLKAALSIEPGKILL